MLMDDRGYVAIDYKNELTKTIDLYTCLSREPLADLEEIKKDYFQNCNVYSACQ
jgi:hypothetical protein